MEVIEQEIRFLKNGTSEMWTLVHQQLYNAEEATPTGDKELAYKVISRERRVNAFELKVDSDRGDIVASHAPVAIDLRFILTMYKIDIDLERPGDFAENIARFAGNFPEGEPIDPQPTRETRVEEMLPELLSMISLTKGASEKEGSETAPRIFLRGNLIDEINHNSTAIITKYIEEHKGSALAGLHMTGVTRKMERFGDHCTNMAGELISYLSAKVMKYMGKTKQ